MYYCSGKGVPSTLEKKRELVKKIACAQGCNMIIYQSPQKTFEYIEEGNSYEGIYVETVKKEDWQNNKNKQKLI
ncbi:hypothetical protein EZS27_003886 [termite gut metagenome]|uniref:Uncharacterized protein n=1 Tax=termite gut metagenome TaxID=433724 RepID=A0A5J4STT3_9ZZZZ